MAKWKSTQTTGLKQDPAKAREWQQRSAEKAIARMREKGAKLAPAGQAGSVVRAGGLNRKVSPGSGSTTAMTRSTSPNSPQKRSQNRNPPKNDGPWRAECIAARGEFCRCCGAQPIQMDHIKPKSQGGKNHVGNGLPLCPEHHRQKTDSEIKIEWAWLDPDQLQYLASIGWVDWDEEGQPFGRGFKHFGTRPPRPGL